ncbi:MAG: glycosyltransferase [bacterium]|nr:glycosyltransferase [bacterium]
MTDLTVLMTVYNGEAYLRETVESVLKQTYKDFKILVVDNASTDSSREIIRTYNDKRIHLVELSENIGQVAALNKGLEMIDTKLVARMDADDINHPQRFQKQVATLEQNPEISICGTFATTFGAKQVRWTYPCSDAGIKVKLLFECSLVHPSVMMRKDRLDKYGLKYDDTLKHSYDWDLWQRAALHLQFANIPDNLINYRLHEKSESTRTLDLQEEVAKKLDDVTLARLGLQNHPLRTIHRETATETQKILNRDEPFLHQVKEWFDKLREANRIHKIYDTAVLDEFLKERFFVVLTKNTRHRKTAYHYYREQKLSRYVPLLWTAKFLLKLFTPGNKGTPLEPR